MHAVIAQALAHRLNTVKEEVADPECRQVANKAYATLHRVGGEGKVTVAPKADPKIYIESLKVGLGCHLHGCAQVEERLFLCGISLPDKLPRLPSLA
eukprot:1158922-Pelagomonas_calceolata.AAC.6